MIEIIPAILPKTHYDIEHGVAKLNDTITTVQIDFVDGTFASNRTWPFNNKDQAYVDVLAREEEGLPRWDDLNYEFDLMLANPLEHLETFITFGPAKIIFHIESFAETGLEPLIAYFESLPEIVRSTIDFGMAINVDTDPSLLEPCIPYITTIQCMGIARVGFQEQPFDARVIEQVEAVAGMYPELIISVDGGMTVETAPLVVKAGATKIVAGSAVFGGTTPVVDVASAIAALRRACWI